MPPVPFGQEGATNLELRLKPPGTVQRSGGYLRIHRLGTDRLGRDVAAGLIHGCRKSLWVALGATLIAILIGLIMGGLAGYWENRMPFLWSWHLIPSAIIFIYLLFLWTFQLINGLSVFIICLPIALFLAFNTRNKENSQGGVFPIDSLVLRCIEVFRSLPTLLILLVISALIRVPSMVTLAILIGFIRWTTFARFVRGEVLKIKARNYILSAKISGVSDRRIFLKYILPEAFGPLMVVFAFSTSSVILLESTLSFLGIGIPVDAVTWGTLLSQARQYPESWWLAVFPGFCILLLVLSLNILGDHLKRLYDVQS